MKKLFLWFLFTNFIFLGLTFAYASDDVTGLWIMPDDKPGNPPAAIVFMYIHEEKLYGRILVLFDSDTGLVEDTINTQRIRENNLVGNPPVCGLDFIFEMENRGKDWRGTIVSLPGGRFYNCTIRREGDNLIVRASLRGVLGFIGANLQFMRATVNDLPEGVELPNATLIVPNIPIR